MLGGEGSEGWIQRYAGETLNAVTGQAIWKQGLSGHVARGRYREWWGKHEDKLEWNAERRRFVKK